MASFAIGTKELKHLLIVAYCMVACVDRLTCSLKSICVFFLFTGLRVWPYGCQSRATRRISTNAQKHYNVESPFFGQTSVKLSCLKCMCA